MLGDLLKQLSREYNKPLHLSEDGVCQILLNEEFIILLEQSPDQPYFMLYADVGPIAPDHKAEVLEWAMKGNLFHQETGEATLGFEPSPPSLVLFQRFSDSIDYPSFHHSLKRFVPILSFWQTCLEKINTGARGWKYFDSTFKKGLTAS